MVVSGLRAVDKSWGCGDMLVLVLGSWQGLWLYFGVLPPNFTQGDGAEGRCSFTVSSLFCVSAGSCLVLSAGPEQPARLERSSHKVKT